MSEANILSDALKHFQSRVPRWLFATNNYDNGIYRMPKRVALQMPYIQPNGVMVWALVFDCDHELTACAAGDGLLPEPNLIVLNPDNGRGHLTYFLKAPVSRTDCSRMAPLRFLASIQRGMTVRLDADQLYPGLITKNPLSDRWRVLAPTMHLYQLKELADFLHSHNCRRRDLATSGYGRNSTLFDELRTAAYQKVIEFHRDGAPKSKFAEWAGLTATCLNHQFSTPLPESEVRQGVKSVTTWVWKRFDFDGFSQAQSRRGQRGNEIRWAGHVAASRTKPWLKLGISRATYYRRKKSLPPEAPS